MNYLYFAEAVVEDSAANPEALLLPASSYLGCNPASATTTDVFWKSADGTQATREVMRITHNNLADGGGFKNIVRALALACNANYPSNDGFIVFADMETGTAVSKDTELTKLVNGLGISAVAIT